MSISPALMVSGVEYKIHNYGAKQLYHTQAQIIIHCVKEPRSLVINLIRGVESRERNARKKRYQKKRSHNYKKCRILFKHYYLEERQEMEESDELVAPIYTHQITR
jgi:hypothetical protein